MRGYGLEKAREYIRSGAKLSMPSGVRVFVDFDGTISLEDTTDVILERFADPEWRKVEAEWLGRDHRIARVFGAPDRSRAGDA